MMHNRVLIKIELYVSAPDNGGPLQHQGHRDVIVEKIHEGELPDGEIGDYTVVEATATLLRLTPVSDEECYKKASADQRKRNAERERSGAKIGEACRELDDVKAERDTARAERDAARAERDERCDYVSKLNTRWDQADRRYGEIALKLRVEAEQAARERDEAREQRNEVSTLLVEACRELDDVKAERDTLLRRLQ